MLMFITSLRHPQNCNSSTFDTVLNLLESTLKSVCTQTDERFRVLVVCHETPELRFKHPAINYLEVNLPCPSDLQQAAIGMDALRIDRGCKYLIGLQHSQRYKPSHIMFFDADDYVSNRLAGFVASNKTQDGWFFKQGYLYDRSLNTLGILDNFHMYCGTSHVVRFDLYSIPSGLTSTPSREQILEVVEEHYLLYILGSHRWRTDYFAGKGKPLQPLSFPGAIYHVAHGENHTVQSGMLNSKCQLIELTDEIRREFSLLEDSLSLFY